MAIAPSARGRHYHSPCANLRVFFFYYGNVTPTAAGIAGGFWNVLGPSRAHQKAAASGVIGVT